MYKRVQYQTITKRLKEPRHFLQVVLGPRQVGKTTVIKQVVNDLNLPYQIYSADSIPATQTSWISDCWNTARVQMRVEKLSEFILIIDEIQKIKNWSEVVKKEWDADTFNDINMKVVLLAGGFGSRISEESQFKPKPMIEIGGMPILWHIMKEYAYYGHTEFIICAGYKQEHIKEWFANYFLYNSDVTFDYRNGKNEMTVHQTNMESWKVTVVDTGYNTMTGGRIKRIQGYVGNEPFLMTYGDGVCDVEIDKLIEFHKSHGKLATLTAVKMVQDKGVLDISENNSVRSFREKNASDGAPINAGYMVLEPQVFDLLDGDACVFEKTALVELANKGELMSYIHEGFWQCMDNIREKNMLENLLDQDKAPWKRWDRQVPSIEARKVTGNI